MANSIFVVTGETVLGGNMFYKTTPTGNQVLKIYENNATITDSTVVGDLTECTLSGYGAITLLRSGWTITTDSGITRAVNLQKNFTFSQVGTVYGFYVVDSNNVLLWVQKFDAPTTTSTSEPIKIIPSIGLI